MKTTTITDLAQYRADLETGGDPVEILATRGQTLDAWRQQEEALLAELADDADRGEFDRIEAYRIAYLAAWKAKVGAEAAEAPVAAGDEPAVDLDATSEIMRVPGASLPFVAGVVAVPVVSAARWPSPTLRERSRMTMTG